MTNLTVKHAPDEHVLIDDLLFQLDAALHIARAIGSATPSNATQPPLPTPHLLGEIGRNSD